MVAMLMVGVLIGGGALLIGIPSPFALRLGSDLWSGGVCARRRAGGRCGAGSLSGGRAKLGDGAMGSGSGGDRPTGREQPDQCRSSRGTRCSCRRPWDCSPSWRWGWCSVRSASCWDTRWRSSSMSVHRLYVRETLGEPVEIAAEKSPQKRDIGRPEAREASGLSWSPTC